MMKKVLVLTRNNFVKDKILDGLQRLPDYQDCEFIYDLFGQICHKDSIVGNLGLHYQTLVLNDLSLSVEKLLVQTQSVLPLYQEAKYSWSDIDEIVVAVTNPWYDGGELTMPEDVLCVEYVRERYNILDKPVVCHIVFDGLLPDFSLDLGLDAAQEFDEVYQKVVQELNQSSVWKRQVLVVCEMPSVEEYVRKFLDQSGLYVDCNIIYDYFGRCFDMKHSCLSWLHGEVYVQGTYPVSGFVNLELQDVVLPKDKYALTKTLMAKNLRESKYRMSNIDEVLFVLGHAYFAGDKLSSQVTYPEDVLAAKYFLEHYGAGLQDVKCVQYLNLGQKAMQAAFDDVRDFRVLYDSVVEEISVKE